MKAQTCPVCDGAGVRVGISDGTQTVIPETDCHGCDGKGWVAVPEERRPLKATADGCSEWIPPPQGS